MHQNLLNAEFASVWYLTAMNKNVHVIRVLKRLQRCCTSAFAAHMPTVNCIFRVNSGRYSIAFDPFRIPAN